MKADLVIKNATHLVTPIRNDDFRPADFLLIENGLVACFNGEIIFVGSSNELYRLELVRNATVIDASEKSVTPGFVDCHTHPIFLGTRENEFEMRIKGSSYEEIAQAGGGIRSSVKGLRGASKEELIKNAIPRMDTFLSLGTTTIEAKSGYGLTVEDEIKSLEVIRELNKIHPLDLVPTFLGAHEIPNEYRNARQDYIDLVIQEMMPRVREDDLAEFCDIFCESHVFDVEESRQVLEAAHKAGFDLKIHADQLTRNGGTALAAELNSKSADHLEFSVEEDWVKMAEHRVVPVMLPGAVFFLGKRQYAPARRMIEMGLPVAVATDFNPGTCMSESMPMILTIACLHLNLTPAEAITAATYHAAMAISRGNLLATLEVGKKADLVIWDVPDYRQIVYHFGVNLTNTVIKSGKIVYENKTQIEAM